MAERFTTEQLRLFSKIPDDFVSEFVEGKDLFIGRHWSVKLTLKPGTTTTIRDLVVLGKLVITSSTPVEGDLRPKLITRDYVCAGSLEITNLFFKSHNGWQPKDLDAFQRNVEAELQRR